MSENQADVESGRKKRKIDPAEFDPDSPADNQRKEAYDSVDTSED